MRTARRNQTQTQIRTPVGTLETQPFQTVGRVTSDLPLLYEQKQHVYAQLCNMVPNIWRK